MNDVTFVVNRRVLKRLRNHLEVPEQLAFMVGTSIRRNDATLRLTDLLLIDRDERGADDLSLELSDSARQRVLRWAAARHGWIVEAHSHGRGSDPARFSIVDAQGLDDWLGHLRWRLPGRPYAALVFGERTFDGVAWLPNGDPVPIAALRAFGSRRRHATRLSYPGAANEGHRGTL